MPLLGPMHFRTTSSPVVCAHSSNLPSHVTNPQRISSDPHTLEPAVGVEPTSAVYETAALPLELRGHVTYLRAPDRSADCFVKETALAAGFEPATYGLTAHSSTSWSYASMKKTSGGAGAGNARAAAPNSFSREARARCAEPAEASSMIGGTRARARFDHVVVRRKPGPVGLSENNVVPKSDEVVRGQGFEP